MTIGPLNIFDNVFIADRTTFSSALFKALEGPVNDVLFSHNIFIGDYVVWNNQGSPFSGHFSNNIFVANHHFQDILSEDDLGHDKNVFLPLRSSEQNIIPTFHKVGPRSLSLQSFPLLIHYGPDWVSYKEKDLATCWKPSLFAYL
jgi:hypothetical protein